MNTRNRIHQTGRYRYLCLTLSQLLCGACSTGSNAPRRMERCAIPFNSLTVAGQAPEDVLRLCDGQPRVIVDTAYLNKVDAYLQMFPNCELAPLDYVDARIVCLVYRSGNVPDTLVFGGRRMSYRDRCCIVDTTFLRVIIDSMGARYRSEYDWYVHGNPPLQGK